MINFNPAILKEDIQAFINENINTDVSQLILKGIPFSDSIKKDIITQIEAKKRCLKKLPIWFNTKNIYFPTKLNIEQTSSEVTARFKASLVSGEHLIDLTGGFGIDDYYFSKTVQQVTHCEINDTLSKIVAHNYKQLSINNANCIAIDGLKALTSIGKTFDWIYIDPSRRDDTKGKVFLLEDCLPNVPLHIDLLLQYSKNIMIKTSPLLDIKSGIRELKQVKTIHCVALNNEVKELLWIIEKDYQGDIEIKTTNLKNKTQQSFDFVLNEETNETVDYSHPLQYLYEPNAAILKSGAFNSISNQLKLSKLHKHSHLYTSNNLVDFPGRVFKTETIIPYNKKAYNKQIGLKQANITTRNFPESVAQIRNKLKIKDGGDYYLFFTTDVDNNKIIIATKRQ